MGYLGTSELASLRSDFEDTLPDTCTIAAVTQTQNVDGTVTPSTSNRGTAIACRMVPATARTFPGLTAEQVTEGRLYTLYVAQDQAVAATDAVTVGANEYQVLQTNADESEAPLKAVLLERRA